jgi:hypothetical protein
MWNQEYSTQEECLKQQNLISDKIISKFPELEWTSECHSKTVKQITPNEPTPPTALVSPSGGVVY